MRFYELFDSVELSRTGFAVTNNRVSRSDVIRLWEDYWKDFPGMDGYKAHEGIIENRKTIEPKHVRSREETTKGRGCFVIDIGEISESDLVVVEKYVKVRRMLDY